MEGAIVLVLSALAQVLDAGVATGTLLLAAATFFLARQARDQALATGKLAMLAEQEIHATVLPELGVQGIEPRLTTDGPDLFTSVGWPAS